MDPHQLDLSQYNSNQLGLNPANYRNVIELISQSSLNFSIVDYLRRLPEEIKTVFLENYLNLFQLVAIGVNNNNTQMLQDTLEVANNMTHKIILVLILLNSFENRLYNIQYREQISNIVAAIEMYHTFIVSNRLLIQTEYILGHAVFVRILLYFVRLHNNMVDYSLYEKFLDL